MDDAARVQERHAGGDLGRGGQQRGDVGPLGAARGRHQERAALDGLLQRASSVGSVKKSLNLHHECAALDGLLQRAVTL